MSGFEIDVEEMFNERAAIRQYNGKMSKEVAETEAKNDVLKSVSNMIDSIVEKSTIGS